MKGGSTDFKCNEKALYKGQVAIICGKCYGPTGELGRSYDIRIGKEIKYNIQANELEKIAPLYERTTYVSTPYGAVMPIYHKGEE